MPVEESDIIIVNGSVRTLEPGAVPAEALAIKGSRIQEIGSSQDVLNLRGAATEVIDADGGAVLPAFTDSHTHFKRATLALEYFIDFDEVHPRDLNDVLSAVKHKAEGLPIGSWIQGDSLNTLTLKERRYPCRQDLDKVAPEHPAILRGVGRHAIAANSLALTMAGITRETPDPKHGRIERDSTGEPTGVLHEQGKLRLDPDHADTIVPPPTVSERMQALSNGVSLLNRLGIVAIHEMPREADQIGDWLRLREREDPRVRVRFYIRGVGTTTKLDYLLALGLRSEFGDQWVRLGGFKVSVDGMCIERNALLYEPYPGHDGHNGLLRVGHDELQDAMRRAHENGLQIAVHAIGQQAVDIALDAFAALDKKGDGLAQRRHRIEHAYFAPLAGQLERMKELGLLLSTQPSFIEAVGDAWVDIFADAELPGVMPIAEAVRVGLPVQLNSDFPCSQLNPFVGIKAAVTRCTRSGHTLDPSQAISVDRALRMMTLAPAFAAFEEGWRGRLSPGYAADVIVVDQDPLEVEASSTDTITVTRTLVGGRMVFVHESIS